MEVSLAKASMSRSSSMSSSPHGLSSCCTRRNKRKSFNVPNSNMVAGRRGSIQELSTIQIRERPVNNRCSHSTHAHLHTHKKECDDIYIYIVQAVSYFIRSVYNADFMKMVGLSRGVYLCFLYFAVRWAVLEDLVHIVCLFILFMLICQVKYLINNSNKKSHNSAICCAFYYVHIILYAVLNVEWSMH